MHNKPIFLTVVFVLFVLTVLPLLLLSTLNSVSYSDQPSLDFTYELYGDRKIKQEFTPSWDFLDGIGMSIKNPNLMNKKPIIMEIYKDNNVVRLSTLNGLNISDGSFIKFRFPFIVGSENKKFEIVLTSPETRNEESLGIFLTNKNNIVDLGNLTADQKIIDGKISLVGFYHVNSKLGLIRYVFNNFIFKFLKDKTFAVFYLALNIFILLVLINPIRFVTKIKPNK